MERCNDSNPVWKLFLNSRLYSLVLLLLTFAAIESKSQTLSEARVLAFNGERAKARSLCQLLLAKDYDPEVAVLMARTYAWDGKYDSTRIVIAEVLKRYPDHWDALDAISDVEYWQEKYQEAINYCDMVLTKNNSDEHFMYKKAKILNAMGLYSKSADQLERLLKKYPGNAEARNKLASIRIDQRKNRIRMTYTYDFFEKKSGKDPWHLAALSYGRKTAIGTMIGRINWAERFGKKGFQYEADGYPSISENNYAYLNIGFSSLSIFPKTRFGAEWYHSFPKAFEGSLGIRALYFANSSTHMLTGTIGKYTGNYWISLRSYVTPSSSGTSASGSVQVRRYFEDPEDYIGFRIGYGISPDDRSYGDGSATYLTLKSQSARLEYNHLFKKVWSTNIGFSLSNEEFPAVGYVVNYSFDIGIGRFF